MKLNCELPIELPWEDCRVSKPDFQRLHELFTDFGFRRYANEMETELAQDKIEETGSPKREWTKVDDKKKFEAFLSELKEQEKFCVDLETTSVDPLQADIVGWAFLLGKWTLILHPGRWPQRGVCS